MEMEKDSLNLLLVDLSARLPYGVKCEVYDRIGVLDEISSYGAAVNYNSGEDTTCRIEYVKPYLFPLSSMTEEQREEYHSFFVQSQRDFITPNNAVKLFDWLLKNHFDYRGLIEKGLAIDCTNLNVY
jgi:hypothetical protein